MKKERFSLPQKFLDRFTLKDMILIAAFAALGLAIKPVVVPLVHIAAASMFIPGGALAGGLYMMWMVVAFGLTGKYGAATLFGFVQALVVIITGITGSHGIMSLVSYTLPGLAVDLFLRIFRHRVCCLPCSFAAGMIANFTGTLAVNFIFFRLPLIPAALSLTAAAFSGGVGGVLAWQILRALRRFRIGLYTPEKQADEFNG
jgi:ABC-type thiamin/hydroxymethylpyrimidine transport system permease subunit